MHGRAGEDESNGRDDDQLLVEAARLYASPSFSAAVREFTMGLARFREAMRLANKLLAHETRLRTVTYLLYLDADRERFGPDGGASYKQLLALCTRRQEISPRVLKTMLALLTFTGFVATRRSEVDRRLKFYHPTPRLLGFLRQRLAAAANALDVLQPEMQRSRLLRDDLGFIERFLVSAGRAQVAGEPPADRMPEFMSFFGGREGAAPVVYTVMLADIDRTPLPSRAHIAKRFGLSKTQVSNIIAEGAKLGFLTPDAAAVPAPTPHLRDSYDRWISIELAFHARHMQPADASRMKP
jgi:hypothetical protein